MGGHSSASFSYGSKDGQENFHSFDTYYIPATGRGKKFLPNYDNAIFQPSKLKLRATVYESQKGSKHLFNYPEENIEMAYHECDTFYAIRVNENDEHADAISSALRKFSQTMKIS